MATTLLEVNSTKPGSEDPLLVVTSDSHVDAPVEHYRPYCPQKYLDAFDEFVQLPLVGQAIMYERATAKVREDKLWNLQTDGHFDVRARLRDMDRDGIAAEVIFHGSPPYFPIPFSGSETTGPIENAELSAAGRQMYNRWLADFCSVEPERHVGLAQLPMWDIEAATKELELARELGLRGVNFPAPRAEITPYEDRAWDPFWSACEDLGMVLANHGGGGVTAAPATGPSAMFVYTTETVTLSRVTPVCRLVYGGVFERHPNLKLLQTEQPGYWYPQVLAELDSQYLAFRDRMSEWLPKLPSEYCRTNYFIGASFQSRFEAQSALRDGVVDNMLWGSDYPHPEGTFRYSANDEEVPMTQLAMRSTYAGMPGDEVRAMLGENAAQVYALDTPKLREVAATINAPTLEALSHPIDERPSHWSFAFRDEGIFT